MIDIRFRKCCEDCSRIWVKEDTLRGDTATIVQIGCEHMEVCGKYKAEAEYVVLECVEPKEGRG